ncbi:uncharacterized protein MYCFIDRAFT_173296 [Pseudocercospora fijiensis CIRAD86]|uniref:Uncharacterized protein n=1 Tax=Pseudocercospora fijiensis (strain CIRAD86) TaxID=383855 RepID=M3B4H6_PSEFD|nr:uncharacterized protein MYCFIDRAFT_173296 [Pseudocercospora fijiensis CIRAD86]EME84268.1 hypothetical protein MYCFIDRAFT_173296 [Pseudocercospora fijiensis CIRAD86]
MPRTPSQTGQQLMMYGDGVLLCRGVNERGGCSLATIPSVNVAVFHLVLIVWSKNTSCVKAQRVHNQSSDYRGVGHPDAEGGMDGIVSRTTMIFTARREANELAKNHQVTNNHVHKMGGSKAERAACIIGSAAANLDTAATARENPKISQK